MITLKKLRSMRTDDIALFIADTAAYQANRDRVMKGAQKDIVNAIRELCHRTGFSVPSKTNIQGKLNQCWW